MTLELVHPHTTHPPGTRGPPGTHPTTQVTPRQIQRHPTCPDIAATDPWISRQPLPQPPPAAMTAAATAWAARGCPASRRRSPGRRHRCAAASGVTPSPSTHLVTHVSIKHFYLKLNLFERNIDIVESFRHSLTHAQHCTQRPPTDDPRTNSPADARTPN